MNSLSINDDDDDDDDLHLKGKGSSAMGICSVGRKDVYLGSPAAMTCNVFFVSLVVSTTRSSLRNRMFSKNGPVLRYMFPS